MFKLNNSNIYRKISPLKKILYKYSHINNKNNVIIWKFSRIAMKCKFKIHINKGNFKIKLYMKSNKTINQNNVRYNKLNSK